MSRLSHRESQIAQDYARGESYQQIADRLCLAPSTVRTHLAAIYRKLGVSSKLDLRDRLGAAEATNGDLDGAFPARPEQPSIAVLAFENMSGDPEQEYFSDGISASLGSDSPARLDGCSATINTGHGRSRSPRRQPGAARPVGADISESAFEIGPYSRSTSNDNSATPDLQPHSACCWLSLNWQRLQLISFMINASLSRVELRKTVVSRSAVFSGHDPAIRLTKIVR
ncbi:LuxR C-terminal-related transcriptional regulator [Sedimentitalea todarodis]|uniref:LuxR C-terminal-related transcriptional regulator n=1 Tax=Sedimentitalea todarodis TaxID=1631240 RepID=A0ABU3VLC4_9RHOB|nr:LuxR C-terminal-related transcriptional regulator [Sedimentitalea todarodis]MDU9006996.1 LuxR C-terminal-related transcriptional regulator [Sedimentitalea todarodis]